jgi:phosphatidylglycerol:prolipoprotein diacylglycerol transferase
MFTYPHINPIAFALGPLKVHWYGLMYLLSFILGWLLANYRAKQSEGVWSADNISDLLFYVALGVILGGRIGYMVFYNFSVFIHNPLSLFLVWQGGMSFHGGLLGVLAAIWLYARRHRRRFFDITDFIAPIVPIGLGAGRIGNFINGELWGRVTNVPWGMIYPQAGPLPRHPSEIYEFFFEGVVLFIILWWFSSKVRPRMAVSALFLLCYGSFRFMLEFFRQPDPQLGFVAFGWITQGQILSLPMIILGAIGLYIIYFRKVKTT